MPAKNFIPKKTPRWKLYTLCGIFVFALGLKIYNSIWPKADVFFGSTKLHVLVADTEQHRYVGWDNKKTMGKYDGMLLVFPGFNEHYITMRRVAFPLDIIWFDNNRIVDIAKDVQPEPGKVESELTPYFSRALFNSVLEVPAGFVDKQQLKIGDRVIVVE